MSLNRKAKVAALKAKSVAQKSDPFVSAAISAGLTDPARNLEKRAIDADRSINLLLATKNASVESIAQIRKWFLGATSVGDDSFWSKEIIHEHLTSLQRAIGDLQTVSKGIDTSDSDVESLLREALVLRSTLSTALLISGWRHQPTIELLFLTFCSVLSDPEDPALRLLFTLVLEDSGLPGSLKLAFLNVGKCISLCGQSPLHLSDEYVTDEANPENPQLLANIQQTCTRDLLPLRLFSTVKDSSDELQTFTSTQYLSSDHLTLLATFFRGFYSWNVVKGHRKVKQAALVAGSSKSCDNHESCTSNRTAHSCSHHSHCSDNQIHSNDKISKVDNNELISLLGKKQNSIFRKLSFVSTLSYAQEWNFTQAHLNQFQNQCKKAVDHPDAEQLLTKCPFVGLLLLYSSQGLDFSVLSISIAAARAHLQSLLMALNLEGNTTDISALPRLEQQDPFESIYTFLMYCHKQLVCILDKFEFDTMKPAHQRGILFVAYYLHTFSYYSLRLNHREWVSSAVSANTLAWQIISWRDQSSLQYSLSSDCTSGFQLVKHSILYQRAELLLDSNYLFLNTLASIDEPVLGPYSNQIHTVSLESLYDQEMNHLVTARDLLLSIATNNPTTKLSQESLLSQLCTLFDLQMKVADEPHDHDVQSVCSEENSHIRIERWRELSLLLCPHYKSLCKENLSDKVRVLEARLRK